MSRNLISKVSLGSPWLRGGLLSLMAWNLTSHVFEYESKWPKLVTLELVSWCTRLLHMRHMFVNLFNPFFSFFHSSHLFYLISLLLLKLHFQLYIQYIGFTICLGMDFLELTCLGFAKLLKFIGFCLPLDLGSFLPLFANFWGFFPAL